MNDDTIKNKILSALDCTDVQVSGDGYHFSVEVTSPLFIGQTRVKRQQMIYDLFTQEIKDGTLHALTIKTFTPE